VPKKPWVGSRSPDGWDQIPRWAGGWVAPATLEFWVRFPQGATLCKSTDCTRHPGILGSIPKREEPGKTGRHPELKYRVPNGSHDTLGFKVLGSSRVPLRRRLCRWQRCCKCRGKPAASARRLPRQRTRETRPSSTRPTPRDIKAESGFPPGLFQPGPAHLAQAHSVAMSCHPAAHQGMAPVQGPPSALRGHTF